MVEVVAQNHGIDPFEFNSHVDDALPLEDLLISDPEICGLLQDVDKSKVKLWLFTNAYMNHGKRVVHLLGIEHLFEGLTYCDYGTVPIISKPDPEMFKRAMKDAGVEDTGACYYVDDTAGHCLAAEKLGWTAVHLDEGNLHPGPDSACKYRISNLLQLREIFPKFFVQRTIQSGQ